MTDNERLANQIVSAALARLENEESEPGDKVVIVLARNNDNVQKLIKKVSCANGRPLTFADQIRTRAMPIAGSGGIGAGLLLLVMEILKS